MKQFTKYLKQAVCTTLAMLIICGAAFPLAVNGIGQLIFKDKANGSMIEKDGEIVGSKLIGQQFTDDRYFKGRISAVNYNTYEEGDPEYGGVASGSYNYGASNPDLKMRVEESIDEFLKAHPTVDKEDIPADLLTASGSGLDPHISISAAEIQIPAVSEASGLSEEQLKTIIKDNTENKVLGVFGENKVNVLGANLDINELLGE